MIDLNIDELDRKLMITESDFERAVLKYLWNYVVNAPVEDYLKDAEKDENVSTTLTYLRFAVFIPYFLRASDIVWDYDEGGDRTYSFKDYFKQLVIDDELIKPYTLNIIKNCLEKEGLINLDDFDAPIDDEYFYNDEKWFYFNDLAECFNVRNYLKSLHINDLTVLFSSITDTADAQNLANMLYANEAKTQSDKQEIISSTEERYFDPDLGEYIELSNDDLDFNDEEDEEDDDDYPEEYEHEFASDDEFVEFIAQHTNELFPSSPTYTQCHLYSYLNGDCD